MASNIIEFFGYSPVDHSPAAEQARKKQECAFTGTACAKTLSDGAISGACTLKPKKNGPVICCPVRLYANKYQILKDVAEQAFGDEKKLVPGEDVPEFRTRNPGVECVAVFGKRWGKELRLPNRTKGAYFVDWILAHVDAEGRLVSFVAVEVQSIDTTGNYRAEREAYLKEQAFRGSSTAGFNWENVNKRILPQLIYKGHVLRREPLCAKGLFFVCPTPVYKKIRARLGGNLEEIHQQAGALTMMWYNVGPDSGGGMVRPLEREGQFTTTIDAVAHAFTAPSELPPAKVYEKAIREEL